MRLEFDVNLFCLVKLNLGGRIVFLSYDDFFLLLFLVFVNDF